MSLESRSRDRARAAAAAGRRRRRRTATLALVLLALALVSPFERARRRAAGRAAQIEAIRDPIDRRIDLNRAGSAALRALPGIGPRQAARILARRQLLGPFECPDDLSRLPGIGNNLVDRLRDLIRVERR